MKIVILYRPNSEFARATESFIRDFQHRHPAIAENIESLDYDSREGQNMAQLYEVMQHPAVLVLRQDGSIVKDWRDGQLPLLDEVANNAYGAA